MKLYDASGDPVTAEMVLDGDELGEYRRQHPHPPVHQLAGYGSDGCTDCGRPMRDPMPLCPHGVCDECYPGSCGDCIDLLEAEGAL